MAYTQVNAVSPSITGTTVALVAPSATAGVGNGEAIPVGSTLWINNGSGSPITITLSTSRTHLGYALVAPTVSIPATSAMLIGPHVGDPFGIQSGTDLGRVHVDYSSVATVTRAVLQF